MEENQQQLERINNYSAMNLEPDVLNKFIDKYVTVQLVKNCSYTGFVHSIDPVSYSLILSVYQENSFKTMLIPGYAITDIIEIERDAKLVPPERKPDDALSLEEIIHKRRRVIDWLKENLLPVSEAGHNIVIGSVTLLPPYSTTDICTENPVIALQIKSLLEKMPQDFEPK